MSRRPRRRYTDPLSESSEDRKGVDVAALLGQAPGWNRITDTGGVTGSEG